MTKITQLLLLIVLICSFESSSLSIENSFIDAEELTAGEEGYGLTVLEGYQINRFPVKYIGRIENAEPKRDLILIRLIGDTFEHSGIVAGMSGSPIYFREKLLGALAYGWAFSKDPIAGVTSIKLMRRLIDEGADTESELDLLRFSTPLWVSGLNTANRGEAWKRIDELGFLTAPGGRGNFKTILEPGSAVGVKLIDGDISIAAIGTVTYVEDSYVLAFGHPFLNRGRSRLPMCAAKIETVLPSQRISFKLGSAGEDLGIIYRDGDPGIAGTVGNYTSMMPMRVNLQTPWSKQEFNYQIARDLSLTPQLIDIAWASSAEVGLFTMGQAGVDVEVKIHTDSRIISLRDRGVVNNSVLEIMPSLPIKILFNNDFQTFFPDKVEIFVKADRDKRRAEIKSVRPLRASVRSGDTLSMEVLLDVFDYGEIIKRIDLPIPSGLKNRRIIIFVSGGRGLAQTELPPPTKLSDIFDRLERYEPSNMFVIRLTGFDGLNLAVDGGILPMLPSNLQRVQKGRILGQTSLWQNIPAEMPISGSASISVEVKNED